MRAHDLMTPHPIAVTPDEPIARATGKPTAAQANARMNARPQATMTLSTDFHPLATGRSVDPTLCLPIDGLQLHAHLAIPPAATGLVLLAEASASARHDRRTRQLAEALNSAGLATLIVDLFTADEARFDAATGALRFDVPLLAARLGAVTDLMARRSDVGHLRVGCLGAGAGAAAALVAAAMRPGTIAAVVARGGRPDLAGPFLPRVTAPTLLIVSGADATTLAYNRDALRTLAGPKRLAIVPVATSRLHEPGALEAVARLAREWLEEHLVAADARPASVGAPS